MCLLLNGNNTWTMLQDCRGREESATRPWRSVALGFERDLSLPMPIDG